LLLAVSPKLGVNSLAELIALARSDPHKIIIGTNPAARGRRSPIGSMRGG